LESKEDELAVKTSPGDESSSKIFNWFSENVIIKFLI
jgi:hypothetical protein